MGAVLHQENPYCRGSLCYQAKSMYYVLGRVLGILLTLEQHLLLPIRSRRSMDTPSIPDICPKGKVRHLKRDAVASWCWLLLYFYPTSKNYKPKWMQMHAVMERRQFRWWCPCSSPGVGLKSVQQRGIRAGPNLDVAQMSFSQPLKCVWFWMQNRTQHVTILASLESLSHRRGLTCFKPNTQRALKCKRPCFFRLQSKTIPFYKWQCKATWEGRREIKGL